MDTSTGKKYTCLYPANAGRRVTEIKSNVKKFEIKISIDHVPITLSCLVTHSMHAQAVGSGEVERRELRNSLLGIGGALC